MQDNLDRAVGMCPLAAIEDLQWLIGLDEFRIRADRKQHDASGGNEFLVPFDIFASCAEDSIFLHGLKMSLGADQAFFSPSDHVCDGHTGLRSEPDDESPLFPDGFKVTLVDTLSFLIGKRIRLIGRGESFAYRLLDITDDRLKRGA
jgi:hypothetical protein